MNKTVKSLEFPTVTSSLVSFCKTRLYKNRSSPQHPFGLILLFLYHRCRNRGIYGVRKGEVKTKSLLAPPREREVENFPCPPDETYSMSEIQSDKVSREDETLREIGMVQ